MERWLAYGRIFIAMLLATLPSLVRAQEGYVRHYPHDSTYLEVYGLMALGNGNIILSATIGDWVQRSYNIQVDGSGDPQWQNMTSLLGREFKWKEATLGDSLFFEAGTFSIDPQTMTDPYMHCYDADGSTRWSRTYDAYQYDQFTNLVVTDAGSIYGLGFFTDTNDVTQSFLIEVDGQGDELFRRTFTDSQSVMPKGFVSIPMGSIVMGAQVGTVPRFTLLGPDHSVVVDRFYPDLTGEDPFMYMDLTPANRILCLGANNTIRELDFNGGILRTRKDSGALRRAIPLSGGGIVLLGVETDGSDFFLRKLDDEWHEEWYQTYSLDGSNYLGAIEEGADGDFFIAGHQGTSAFEPHTGLLIRTDCAGRITDYKTCLPPLPVYALYPNPNAGAASLAIPADAVGHVHIVQVYDAIGRLVLEQATVGESLVDLDLSHLEPAIYFLRVVGNGTVVWTARWILTR